MQLARLKQEYNKNPIYRVLYLFIGFYRFVRTGTDEYNYALGLKRAKATKDTMVQEGFVNPERIHIVSKGESEPVCQNHTKECDALNRRSEIVIYPLK